MNSRLTHVGLKLLVCLLMTTLFASCQDTIPNRSLISGSQTDGGTSGGGTSGGTPDVVTRPSDAVFFKTDFCGCKDGKAVTYGNCSTFCSNQDTNGGEIFFANFTVTEAISLNSSLGSVAAWCNTPLPDSTESSNPKCILEAKDDTGNVISLDVTVTGTSNSIKVAKFDDLKEDKAYVLTLVSTPANVKSDSIQIIKFSTDIPLSSLGPLKNAPISQYTCMFRDGSVDSSTGDYYYSSVFRVHYYFIPRIPPEPIPAGSSYFCHDIFNPLYGALDDILYPRLELIPGVFNLWDTTDPRFYDNNGNNNNDVNDIVIQKAKNFGATGISAATNFFEKFPELSSSTSTTSGSTVSTAQSMGYYMSPWIDQSTFKSFCLNSTHYSSSNPLYKALGSVVGVDMEGIYIGVKPTQSYVNSDGNNVTAPADFIFVRETDLKKVWFYMKNNVPTVPTDAIVSSVPVYFYYPLNLTSPYIKSSSQQIYQVKGASELSTQTVSTGGSNSSGVKTSYPPHDRKIGCVPKF